MRAKANSAPGAGGAKTRQIDEGSFTVRQAFSPTNPSWTLVGWLAVEQIGTNPVQYREHWVTKVDRLVRGTDTDVCIHYHRDGNTPSDIAAWVVQKRATAGTPNYYFVHEMEQQS